VATGLIREVVTGASALHNVIIWVFHLSYLFATKTNQMHLISFWGLTLVTAASIYYLLVPWFTSYNLWDVPLSETGCKWLMMTTKLSFIYPKTLGLYFVYIERLFHIFRGKAHPFKNQQKWTLRAIIVGSTLMVTVVIFMSVDDGYIFDPDNNSCFPQIDLKGVGAMVSADLFICNMIATLYCRRLFFYNLRLTARFLSHSESDPESVGNEDFRVMAKMTVLAFVATMSTQVAILLVTVVGVLSMWAAMDSVINCWCLVLIFGIYDNMFGIYHFCCCCCQRLMCYRCILCYSCHWICPIDHLLMDSQKTSSAELTVRRQQRQEDENNSASSRVDNDVVITQVTTSSVEVVYRDEDAKRASESSRNTPFAAPVPPVSAVI